MDDQERAKINERIKDITAQRAGQWADHLIRCGLSPAQIDETLRLVIAYFESSDALTTILKQDLAESEQQYKERMAEIEADRARHKAEIAAEDAEIEERRTKVHEPPIPFDVCVKVDTYFAFKVIAASEKEAGEKGIEYALDKIDIDEGNVELIDVKPA